MVLPQAQQLDFIPKRIISLVPSQTELLHYLNLEEETIGITKFCIHPKEWFRNKTRVGGTKTINIAAIKKLQPDLIIANKEENVQSQVQELANDFNVLVTDVNTVEEALQMIQHLGQLTAKEEEAATLITKIKNEFLNITCPFPEIPTAYLIWNKPYMAVGNNTFINDILVKSGLQNIFATTPRYPQITVEDLQNAHCKLLLLSTEPYPFKQKYITELQKQLPDTKIILADGEMFSWYGSRMLLAPAYINALLANINQ